MAIVQLRMDPVMVRPMGPDLTEAIGMAGLTDMVAGVVGGMQLGALGGDTLLIQLLTHTRLAYHLPYMCSRF